MDIDNSNLSSGEKVSTQINPLEQYLLLAKGAKGSAAVQLICQVLEAPGVYVFSELLDCGNIEELQEIAEHKKYWDLLKLFTYGVYSDYVANENNLPQISDSMIKKLRHLTIVSLATGHKSLSLSDLSSELDIASTRQLEDLIIEAIYAGIVSGRLDQKNGVLEVDYAIGRDIKKEDLSNISATLQEWCQNCDKMLDNVHQLIIQANLTKEENTKQKMTLDQEISNVKASLKAQTQDNDEQLISESRDSEKKRATKKSVRNFWQKNS